MDPSIYAYLNAILDTYPDTALLSLDTAPRPEGYSVYDIATGPVPEDQVDLASRVTLEADPEQDDVSRGHAADGSVLVVFRC